MWFKQILKEGLVLGLLVSAALVAPWPWLKAPCIVAVAYVLVFIQRDPRSFYRRMFRMVVGAMIVLPSLSFAGEVLGFATSPWFTGVISLTAAAGEAAPPWAWVLLAGFCIAADLAQYVLVDGPQQARAALITPSESVFSISPVQISSKLTVTNDTDQAVTVVGVTLTLGLPAPITLNCELGQQEVGAAGWSPVTATKPLIVPAKTGGSAGTGVVMFRADLPNGWRRRWLVFRSRLFTKLAGNVELSANYDVWQAPREIKFHLSQTESGRSL